MKNFLIATSVFALVFTTQLAAPSLAAADKPAGEKVEGTVSDAWASFKEGAKEAWESTVQTFDDLTRRTQQDLLLPQALPGALSARAVIGMPIENGKEGRVGSISDLVLGNDFRVDAIVVSDGGFLGINNAQIAVKPSLITIRRDEKGALRARTNVTEKQLDAASNTAFTTRIQAMSDDFKKPNVKTVSRLLTAAIVDQSGKSVAKVSDILLSPVGEARYALVVTGGTMGVGSKMVAIPVSSLTFTTSDQPLKTTLTADQLGKLAPVRAQASAS